MKRYLGPLLILALLTPMLASCGQSVPVQTPPPRPKAVIVDQLSVLEPDSKFVDKAVTTLESAGFSVDVWRGQDVTVDYYRELPTHEYRLIILRVHSGILLSVEGSQLNPLKTTYLFTGETYTPRKYVSDQLTDKVSNALMTDRYPLVFAVNSQFVAEDFKGSFDNAVIIAMGCESSYQDDMAAAFIKKGASAFIGWSTVVSLNYVDDATLVLLDNLVIKNMPLGQGITSTMSQAGTDPYFGTYLKSYPGDAEDQTIKMLVGRNSQIR